MTIKKYCTGAEITTGSRVTQEMGTKTTFIKDNNQHVLEGLKTDLRYSLATNRNTGALTLIVK